MQAAPSHPLNEQSHTQNTAERRKAKAEHGTQEQPNADKQNADTYSAEAQNAETQNAEPQMHRIHHVVANQGHAEIERLSTRCIPNSLLKVQVEGSQKIKKLSTYREARVVDVPEPTDEDLLMEQGFLGLDGCAA